MEALQMKPTKIGELTKETIEKIKRKKSDPLSLKDFEMFNIVTYIDGVRAKIGTGWMGDGKRPKIILDLDKVKLMDPQSPSAWFFPKNSENKEKKK